MSCRNNLLSYVKKDGLGIEIGPSHNPMAPKKAGYNVEIIDHMTREQLVEKYREHQVCLENIEEVDHVWNGESYCQLTGRESYYDWVIASHMIEHTPDFIGFLLDCEKLLKDDGVLLLVVPDKRYCFDHYRPITGLSKVVDAYIRKDTIHTPGTVAEYYLNVVSKGGGIAWASGARGKYEYVHGVNDALNGINLVVEQKAYIDVHSWCFVPNSFRLLINDLNALGFISLREVKCFKTEGCEFAVVLSRSGSGPSESRLDLAEMIESDLKT